MFLLKLTDINLYDKVESLFEEIKTYVARILS